MAAKHHSPYKTTLAVALSALAAVLASASRAAAAGSASSRPSTVQVIRITTHGFDWGDAAIGAAAGIAISMLAVGATLLITGNRQQRRSLASSPPSGLQRGGLRR